MKMTYEDVEWIMDTYDSDFRGMVNVDKFLPWAKENMHVINKFYFFSLELLNGRKRDHYSAYTVRERIRWHSDTAETNTEYKISNNVTPCIARVLMRHDVRLKDMFRIKRGFIPEESDDD